MAKPPADVDVLAMDHAGAAVNLKAPELYSDMRDL
jgi:hypothetical protein